jgi:hypothetical protein
VAKSTINRLTLNANRCRKKYAELEDKEEDDGTPSEEDQSPPDEAFDINSVFVDL